MGNSIIEAQQEYFDTQFERIDGKLFYAGFYIGVNTQVHLELQRILLSEKLYGEQVYILTAAKPP